ncbi:MULTISPECIES: hypothetical protein [Nocardia]|uniref:Uncharacterized protein n=1 Tax=Nocardia nova TaxID=37330 RepID=A0A2T2ZAX1_9NOCA|nr:MULTISPECIES: hypothetical protein [Nocardia]OBF80673.1 hypothetical protein A9X06_20845 [Mycobacterium sp. 852002-51759_SCH5129042]MBF6276741.1 hypothetical protein [Nocardia nova]OBA54825.1 hypothetical protein A5789_21395 [Nocardia sp. 852002-51101_SCH5132738]OBB48736.1 hypothetical protein A5748_21360 [Nocardia sp. 852002-51244_SCH5132740]PSR64918.1 hypothetical protein C8259_08100 [Nocardia nova]
MANNGPFGIDPEEFERALREAEVEFRDLLGKAAGYLDRSTVNSLTSLFGQFVQPDRARTPEPDDATTGETGSGVWAVYSVDDAGEARVEQVFPTELEALRAHRDNTDERRKVRFLPYGVPAGVLDQT